MLTGNSKGENGDNKDFSLLLDENTCETIRADYIDLFVMSIQGAADGSGTPKFIIVICWKNWPNLRQCPWWCWRKTKRDEPNPSAFSVFLCGKQLSPTQQTDIVRLQQPRVGDPIQHTVSSSRRAEQWSSALLLMSLSSCSSPLMDITQQQQEDMSTTDPAGPRNQEIKIKNKNKKNGCFNFKSSGRTEPMVGLKPEIMGCRSSSWGFILAQQQITAWQCDARAQV